MPNPRIVQILGQNVSIYWLVDVAVFEASPKYTDTIDVIWKSTPLKDTNR